MAKTYPMKRATLEDWRRWGLDESVLYIHLGQTRKTCGAFKQGAKQKSATEEPKDQGGEEQPSESTKQ